MKIIVSLITLLLVNVTMAATHWGTKVSVGNGYARTFFESKDGEPKALGVALSHGALTNLPHDMIEFVLPLPSNFDLPPFNHVAIDWNPHGHEPLNIYTLPHFDFHFYTIPLSVRNAITCMGADEANCLQSVPASLIADKYGPTPAGVPKMGWHWVDLLAPEFNGGKFSHTFIYGYYKGDLAFLEPMVTIEEMESRRTSVAPIRWPSAFEESKVMYPTKYKVTYDRKLKLYKVMLTEFN